ncbi:MAG: regulatory protein RecX [Clostridiales bacterium]|nr:regulatory protein RecX [Clostridiales bacterium]
MIITKIEEINIGRGKNKLAFLIYADENFIFLFYSQDIRNYQLKEGCEITPSLYERIIEETVYRRAKQKALATLKRVDKTEKEIRLKLKDGYYTDEIIDMTIDYLEKYNYINDERYTSNYIRTHKLNKSKLAIKTNLLKKGINKTVLEKIIFDEYINFEDESDPEMIAIQRAVHKKYNNISSLSWKEKQKLIASLYRKGFDIDKIQTYLKE